MNKIFVYIILLFSAFSLQSRSYYFVGFEREKSAFITNNFIHQFGFITFPILGDNIEFERTPSYKRFFIEPQIGLFGLSRLNPVFDASYIKILYKDDKMKTMVLGGSLEFFKKPLGIPLVPYYRYVNSFREYKSHEAGLTMTIPFSVIGK